MKETIVNIITTIILILITSIVITNGIMLLFSFIFWENLFAVYHGNTLLFRVVLLFVTIIIVGNYKELFDNN